MWFYLSPIKTVHPPFARCHPCQVTRPTARVSPASQTLVHTSSSFLAIPVALLPRMFSLEQWIECVLLLPFHIIPLSFLPVSYFSFFNPSFPTFPFASQFTSSFFISPLATTPPSSCHALSFLSSSTKLVFPQVWKGR